MITLLALFTTFLGVFLLKERGSYSTQGLKKSVGWLINVVALVLFTVEFGIARGTFVYLGVFAFIGIAIALLAPDTSQSNPQ